MNQQQVYRQLAAFKHAAEEENAQLLAQWKILGARWLELAGQSKTPLQKTSSKTRSHGIIESSHRLRVRLALESDFRGLITKRNLKTDDVSTLKPFGERNCVFIGFRTRGTNMVHSAKSAK
jgi:hypothetical protein